MSIVHQNELTQDEARALTDRIKSTAGQLWALLLEAHERKAWQALGYPSWRDYAGAEFGLAKSHVYRLLDQGRVIRELEKAAGSNSPLGEIVTERAAREIRPKLTLVTADIGERIKQGEGPEMAVQNAVAEARKASYLVSRKRQDRSNRIVESIVVDMEATADAVAMIDYSTIDISQVPEWAAALRGAASKLISLAGKLERAAKSGAA